MSVKPPINVCVSACLCVCVSVCLCCYINSVDNETIHAKASLEIVKRQK